MAEGYVSSAALQVRDYMEYGCLTDVTEVAKGGRADASEREPSGSECVRVRVEAVL